MSDFPLHIDVHSVKDLLDANENFLLLDCREANEYAIARIDGLGGAYRSRTASYARGAQLSPRRIAAAIAVRLLSRQRRFPYTLVSNRRLESCTSTWDKILYARAGW